MNFLEKLDYLMKERSINRSKLSKISGVPYTTIDGFYKKGYENTKLSTIRKISEALNVSLDYLINEDDNKSTSVAETAPGEGQMVALYRELNTEGRAKLLDYADDLVSSGKYIKSDKDKLANEKYA